MNTKVSCKCAQPTIIVNPKLDCYDNSIISYHILDCNHEVNISSFNLRKIARKAKYKCDYNNINQFYFITTTAEVIPLYILVPCNHCFICHKKHQSQWQFRAIAESNSSTNHTYFVTLTYNNDFLPANGVNVRAIQLFMKRLRHNLDKLNIPHNIKYFSCGEYGKNTHRPHYHLIIWHFPDDYFKNITSILDFIEKSWSVYNYDTEEHILIGFAYCKPCDSGSMKYVMKYTTKDKSNIPQNCNPSFTTCSKYIGYNWFIDNYEYLKQNPQLITISINDPIKGDIHTSSIPLYYRQKLMPDISKLLPPEIIDAYKYCLSLHTQLNTLNDIENFNYKTPQTLKYIYDKLHLLSDSNYNVHPLDTAYIDSYYNSYYNTFYNYQIEKEIIYKKSQLDTYLLLLKNYIKQVSSQLEQSYTLKTKRNLHLSLLPKKEYLLTELQAINERYYNDNIKTSKREYF